MLPQVTPRARTSYFDAVEIAMIAGGVLCVVVFALLF
jgi:hypothetical protein